MTNSSLYTQDYLETDMMQESADYYVFDTDDDEEQYPEYDDQAWSS
jgi:hypothetical protein